MDADPAGTSHRPTSCMDATSKTSMPVERVAFARERPDRVCGDAADPSAPELVECLVDDDAVQPRPERAPVVVLLPSLPSASECLVRRIDRLVGVAQDRVGDPVDVRRMVSVREVDGAVPFAAHNISTNGGRDSLRTECGRSVPSPKKVPFG